MSDRPSRQDLVVPQKRSNLPLVLGAVASGCAGFAAVWALGLGRSAGPEGVDAALEPPVAGVIEPSTAPDTFNATSPAAATAPPQGDRYAVQPTSLDQPAGVVGEEGRASRFSRFSASQDLPVTPATAETPAEIGRAHV